MLQCRPGGDGLLKLNFEKTAVFVLILILCISTANIYSQFFNTLFNREVPAIVHTDIVPNISFPAGLVKADQLYEQGSYTEAQSEYLKLASMPNLSPKQKATVHFKLGVCNFRLKQYDMARDSFLKAAEFNTEDSVSYNNAAVCSFYMNDLERAEELQKKAVGSLPVIEYYYNLARIYEVSGNYLESAKYFAAVVRGEENLTRDDRIDPVRIKNKMMQLFTGLENTEKIFNELMIALRLKDAREVFIIEDADMDIRDKSFKWYVVKENGTEKLYCSFDREKSDPYHLIDSIRWTVRSGGRTVYRGSKDGFSISLNPGSNYLVDLDIYYSKNKQASSTVDISSSNIYTSNVRPTADSSREKPKYYDYAVYEQVFERGFNISNSGYVDRFNTIWGKDDIETAVITQDFIDAQSALHLKNGTEKKGGIWADLSALIKDKKLNGKTVTIKFYGRKISDDANLYMTVRTKLGAVYKNTTRRFDLEDKWKQFSTSISVPYNADGLTVSFRIGAGEEIRLDGFIITVENKR